MTWLATLGRILINMINESNRNIIFELILNTKGAFDFSNNFDNGIIPFLNEIWNLKTMPSEDHRFSNAEQDVHQHTINNDDWDLNYLLRDRLKLIENSDKFKKFLEIFLSKKYQRSPDGLISFTEKINKILESDKLALAIISYDDDFPVIELTKLDVMERPLDIPVNGVPFFSLPYPNMSIFKFIDGMEVELDKPSRYFVLVADNWDDFNYKTHFGLVYFENGKKTVIGNVKIASNINPTTIPKLPDKFFSLGENFFSLGQSESYYNNLNALFGNMITSVLYSLKDAAFFSEVSDEFDTLDVFKYSLIRDDKAERVHRIAKPMVRGVDLENLYSFKYQFTPKYADTTVSIPFDFSTKGHLPKRMIALIGKNGAGKTQLRRFSR